MGKMGAFVLTESIQDAGASHAASASDVRQMVRRRSAIEFSDTTESLEACLLPPDRSSPRLLINTGPLKRNPLSARIARRTE